MKKRNVLFLAAAMFIAGFGFNNIAMSDLNQKIAVVNVPAVVSKSSQVAALKKEQQTKMSELDKWLKSARADVEKQQTKEGKEKLLKKYNSEFEKKRQEIAKDYKAKLATIDSSISSTISQYAKNQGYNIVLTKGVVLYGGEDITAAIQKEVK